MLAPLWLLVALLPMAALFSALCIALASFARSTKEGQYYLMPLVLITLPLVVLPMAPNIELSLGMSLIPVTGVVLLLKSLLEGRYLEVLPYTLTVGAVTGGCCLLALRWAVDQFNSENVLFREGERGGLGLWLRHLVRDREDTPSVAESLLCGVLIMTVYFFMSVAMPHPSTVRDFLILAVVTQLAVILTPTLAMTAICTRSPRQTLLLYAPKVTSIVGAVVLALVLHPSVLVLSEVLQRLYPINPEILKLGRMLDGADPWMLVVAMALVPAIVEELAFRGFILSGLRRMGNRRQAVVVSAIFFAFCHGTAVQQAINAGLLGLLLGYLAIQSGNIFTGIAFHATNNAAAVLLPTVVGQFVMNHPQWSWVATISPDGKHIYHPLIIAAGIVVAGAILRGFAKLSAILTYEEELTEAIRRGSSEATAA
jgi:sodium transport system permease protein